MIQVKHGFVSQVVDGTDISQVQPSHWNSDHQVQMEGPGLLGRVSGTGEVQKITLGANLTFSGTSLVATSGGGSSGGAELGSSIPSNLGTAAAGISLLAAREDHVHNLPTLQILGAASEAHIHTISNITGLQTALDGKAASVHGHAISNITDLQSTLDSKANTSHIHTISNITGLQIALDGKAALVHGHAISDVTGLQTALDDKANAYHGHAISDVTGLQTALEGKAALVHGHAISDVTGLQTALDGKATSIQGTKADTAVQPADLTKAAVGLSNVDNTSDLAKPISTSVQTALSGLTIPAQVGTFANITTVVNTDVVPIVSGGVGYAVQLDKLLADTKTIKSLTDAQGNFAGLAGFGGTAASEYLVVSTAYPVDEDGRPDGTIFIQVA